MEPSIGRIVHYTNLGDRDGKYPPEVQAAIITGVNADDTVALHIPACQHTDEPAGSDAARGRWSWPARV